MCTFFFTLFIVQSHMQQHDFGDVQHRDVLLGCFVLCTGGRMAVSVVTVVFEVVCDICPCISRTCVFTCPLCLVIFFLPLHTS